MKKYFLPILFLIIILGLTGLWFWYAEKAKLQEGEQILKEHPLSEKFMKDLEAAKNRLNEAKNAEERFSALSQIGFIYDIAGANELAKSYYNQSLKIKDDEVVYNNLANIYVEEKNFSKAEESFLRVIELAPSSIEGWRDLHELYRYSMPENVNLADDILLKGLEINSNNPGLLSALAAYYHDMGDKDKAIEFYEKLLEVSPDNEAAKKELEGLKK